MAFECSYKALSTSSRHRLRHFEKVEQGDVGMVFFNRVSDAEGVIIPPLADDLRTDDPATSKTVVRAPILLWTPPAPKGRLVRKHNGTCCFSPTLGENHVFHWSTPV
jgi:hypothetical protein